MQAQEEAKGARQKDRRASAGQNGRARKRLVDVLQRSQILLYPATVDTQELVGSGSHVDQVRLALGAFLVHETVHRVILRLCL